MTIDNSSAAPHAGLALDPADQKHRDLDFDQVPEVGRLMAHTARLLRSLPEAASAEHRAPAPIPASVSLRAYCGKVRDQGALNACTAHAAVALIELIEAKFEKRVLSGSPMFVYKSSRDILRWSGDSGAFLRTAAGSLAMLGVLPEEYWAYDPALLDQNPPPFCYQIAQHFRATRYFRIDSDGVPVAKVIDRMKRLLVHGVPAMLGYTVFFGAEFQARANAGIVVPLATDIQVGRHALMVCGYDDDRTIVNTSTGGESCVGAFLVQNSRGAEWGDGGFGWLPYAYFERGWVNDIWSVVNATIADLQPFEENATPPAPPAAQAAPSGTESA
jgi:C1A family cysteine protease